MPTFYGSPARPGLRTHDKNDSQRRAPCRADPSAMAGARRGQRGGPVPSAAAGLQVHDERRRRRSRGALRHPAGLLPLPRPPGTGVSDPWRHDRQTRPARGRGSRGRLFRQAGHLSRQPGHRRKAAVRRSSPPVRRHAEIAGLRRCGPLLPAPALEDPRGGGRRSGGRALEHSGCQWRSQGLRPEATACRGTEVRDRLPASRQGVRALGLERQSG